LVIIITTNDIVLNRWC